MESAAFWEQPVTVRVPATSANLGPGFDCLGLALGLYDEVTAQAISGQHRVEIVGVGAETLASDASHLVLATALRTFEHLNVAPPVVGLHCVNAIPQARGLGSSSAAIVAGVLLARALLVDGDDRLSDAQVMDLVVNMEGHPDNAAPCLLGGFVVAWGPPNGAKRLPVHPDITPIVLVPDTQLLTETARSLLPDEVPMAEAVSNISRAALLVEALTRDPALLMPATVDRLHQERRRPAMPQSLALLDDLRAAGIPAVVSGAGPSLLALCATAEQVSATRAAGQSHAGWQVLEPGFADAGAGVVAG